MPNCLRQDFQPAMFHVWMVQTAVAGGPAPRNVSRLWLQVRFITEWGCMPSTTSFFHPKKY